MNSDKKKRWINSHYNVLEQPLTDSVEFHDLTLRDGEQHAGVVFRKDEKVEIARALAELGVHNIEVAMPIVSKEDRDAIKAIARLKLGPKLRAVCRARQEDIDYALDCGVDSVQVSVAATDQYLKTFGWSLDDVIEMVSTASKYAGDNGLEVTLAIMDVSRMQTERFLEIANRVDKSGHVDTITLMDTFGLISPHGVINMINKVQKECHIPFEAHFHNDFGLGTACTIAAIGLGVKHVQVSVNGLGERIGNTPLEEVVMALEVLYDYSTGLNLSKINQVSELVQKLSGVKMPSCKPIVGENLRVIESGLVATEYMTMLEKGEEWVKHVVPFMPTVIGKKEPEIVLGKLSGISNIEWNLSRLNLFVDEKHKDLHEKVQEKATEKHGLLTDQEFEEIVKNIVKQ